MELKVRKLYRDAELPKYGTDGAACFDLQAYAAGEITKADAVVLNKHGISAHVEIHPGASMEFSTGLAFEIPEGFALMIYSRSGHGFRHGLRLANCVGIIDSDYRGEVVVSLRNDGARPYCVNAGDRIAQAMLVPAPRFSFVEVDELSETARGAGGFGSTGQ